MCVCENRFCWFWRVDLFSVPPSIWLCHFNLKTFFTLGIDRQRPFLTTHNYLENWQHRKTTVTARCLWQTSISSITIVINMKIAFFMSNNSTLLLLLIFSWFFFLFIFFLFEIEINATINNQYQFNSLSCAFPCNWHNWLLHSELCLLILLTWFDSIKYIDKTVEERCVFFHESQPV